MPVISDTAVVAQTTAMNNHASAGRIYTCPMHPEVQQDHPGACPKCGMALELKVGATSQPEDGNAELRDMTRRFWVGLALAAPVFVLAMAHVIPALARQPWVDGMTSRWVQFILTIPVVAWAGWPFFVRGWQSLRHWHLNMFTLIAIGVGAAFRIQHGGDVTPRRVSTHDAT